MTSILVPEQYFFRYQFYEIRFNKITLYIKLYLKKLWFVYFLQAQWLYALRLIRKKLASTFKLQMTVSALMLKIWWIQLTKKFKSASYIQAIQEGNIFYIRLHVSVKNQIYESVRNISK